MKEDTIITGIPSVSGLSDGIQEENVISVRAQDIIPAEIISDSSEEICV